MAVDTSRNPYILSEVGDSIPDYLKVDLIKAVTEEDVGDVILLDKEGGREIYKATLGAGETENTNLSGWVRGVYVAALPSAAKVYIYVE